MEFNQRVKQQELELMENRVSIMLSQIQPRFLYNILTAIEYLCNKDGAKQAGKVIRDFSKYLRGNGNSQGGKGGNGIEGNSGCVTAAANEVLEQADIRRIRTLWRHILNS